MSRHHLTLSLILAIVVGMWGGPRPARGDYSPEYIAGLKKTAELKARYHAARKRGAAIGMAQVAAMQEAAAMAQRQEVMMLQAQMQTYVNYMNLQRQASGNSSQRIYTAADTFNFVAAEEAYLNGVAGFIANPYHFTAGSYPEINPAPAAGALALLAAGMLILTERRRRCSV